MENYRTLRIPNTYGRPELLNACAILNTAGIETDLSDETITLRFDTVDIPYIQRSNHPSYELVRIVLDELAKIRSFSTANGKTVFKSFNKEKKVSNKAANKKKRLGYEYYKRQFATANNTMPEQIVDKIYCADSAHFLKQLPDNCVDLVLTSPPYNFGISYNSTDDKVVWHEYFQTLFAVLGECVRTLKSGGRIVVNIQPLFSDYIPSHHIISNYFINQGLIWKGEIMWEKNNYSCKYCTWGSWQSPSSPYLKYSWEFIEIFCKNSLKKEGAKDRIDLIADEFKRWVYGKWSIAPERNMKRYKHDAMFPEELARRVIKLFSYKYDIVLDPFNGAGTTTKVARELERRFIGIDIDEQYCQTARNRLRETDNSFNH